jgi:hypothetical protein
MTPAQIHELVYIKKTRFKKGFTQSDIDSLLKKFPSVSTREFNLAMGTTTVQIINGEIVYYHQDVEMALRCCIEKREPNPFEFD